MTKSLEWKTEKRKISDLKDHPHNPRQINETQFLGLQKSFKTYNYVELAAIDKDNTILAGHMRIRALISLGKGEEEIEVRVPNRKLSKKERDGYVIASNHMTGEDDFDILANHWDTDLLFEWGMTEKKLDFVPEEKLIEEEEKEKSVHKCESCGQKLKKK